MEFLGLGWIQLIFLLLTVAGLSGGLYRFVKKLPLVGTIAKTQQIVLIIGIIGFVVTGGMASINFTDFGGASIAGTSGFTLVNSQISTAFATNAGGSVSAETNAPKTVEIYLSDIHSNETATFTELDTGVIRVQRGGDLSADSCDVRASVPADYLNKDGSDSTTLYHLIERDGVTGEIEVYLEGAASSGAATTSSAKMADSIPFAEGVKTGFLGITFEVSETGHDALVQYGSLPVHVDVCGEMWTFNVHKMD